MIAVFRLYPFRLAWMSCERWSCDGRLTACVPNMERSGASQRMTRLPLRRLMIIRYCTHSDS